MDSVEVANVFVISNTDGVTVDQLNNPTNSERVNVDDTYASIVQTTIDSEFPGSRYLRTRRNLKVDYVSAGARQFTEVACPTGAAALASCQQARASFFLAVSSDEDAEQVSADAKAAVDAAIAAGDMQSLLNQKGSAISVEEGAPIVDVPTSAPSLPPTMAATDEPTSAGFTGDITIESVFYISNTINVSAADLRPDNKNRVDLEAAYNNTASGVVTAEGNEGIGFVPTSGVITDIVDVPCPASLTNATLCQRVTAQYNISVVSVDKATTLQGYTDATNTAIVDGQLQNALDKINRSTPIQIEWQMSTQSPTKSPKSAPTDGGGLSTSSTIFIAVGCAVGVLLLCIGAYVLCRRRPPRGSNQGRPGKAAASKGDGFGYGYVGPDDAGKTDMKGDSSASYKNYGVLDDSEVSGSAVQRKAAADKDMSKDSFARFNEDSDSRSFSESDASRSDSGSESMSEDPHQNVSADDDSQASSNLDDYEFDDPTGIDQKKIVVGAANQPSSDEDSESSQSLAQQSISDSASRSASESVYDSESSQENDDGWDDDDGSVSQPDNSEDIDVQGSFSHLAAKRCDAR